jgi:hypothetical protein
VTYLVSEPSIRDRIRGLVFDDSNDPATEYLTDERYDMLLARYPDDWRLAAIAAAKRIIGFIADRPVALGSDGDSIRWSDKRVTKLEGVIVDLIAELEGETLGQVFTVTDRYLTGDRTAVAEWS